MLRAFFVAATLVTLLSSCGGGAKCGDLCSQSMPCGDTKYTCVQSRCLIVSDAGPTACPTM